MQSSLKQFRLMLSHLWYWPLADSFSGRLALPANGASAYMPHWTDRALHAREVERQRYETPEALCISAFYYAPIKGRNALRVKTSAIGFIAAALVMFQTNSALACDANCEDTIDTLSASARKSDQSVARGRNQSVVVNYGAGVPLLKCRPLNFCSIQLQPGERPTEDLTLGDDVLWDAQLRVSKSLENPEVRVIVKPDAKATQTSLIITTNRRIYDVQLVKSDTDYTHLLAFTYPKEIAAENSAKIAQLKRAKDAKAKQRSAARARNSLPVGTKSVQISKLDFNYSIKGSAPFKPTRVFTDGKKTYIDIPDRYNGEKPVFLAGLTKKSTEIVNARWSGNRLTIDRVITSGSLVRGIGGRAQKITLKKGH